MLLNKLAYACEQGPLIFLRVDVAGKYEPVWLFYYFRDQKRSKERIFMDF